MPTRAARYWRAKPSWQSSGSIAPWLTHGRCRIARNGERSELISHKLARRLGSSERSELVEIEPSSEGFFFAQDYLRTKRENAAEALFRPLRYQSLSCAINPYPAHEPRQRPSKAQQMALRFAHGSTRVRLKHYAERSKSALSVGRPFPSAGSHCLHALNTLAHYYQIGPIFFEKSLFIFCQAPLGCVRQDVAGKIGRHSYCAQSKASSV